MGPKIPAHRARRGAKNSADLRERLTGQVQISGSSDLCIIETQAAQASPGPAQVPHHRGPMKSDLTTHVTRRRTCLVEPTIRATSSGVTEV